LRVQEIGRFAQLVRDPLVLRYGIHEQIPIQHTVFSSDTATLTYVKRLTKGGIQSAYYGF
jgi:hypothetical protein